MPANDCHLKVHLGMEHTCIKGWEGVGYYHPHKMFGPHLPSPSKIPPVPLPSYTFLVLISEILLHAYRGIVK